MKKLRCATGGCFSFGVHYGHLKLLEHLRDIAGSDGEVEVYVNSDASVARLKGIHKLIYPENERVALLKAIRYVDNVFVFQGDDPSRIIFQRQPHVWLKSSGHRDKDEMPETKVVELYGGRVEIWESPVNISTSQIMERIRNG